VFSLINEYFFDEILLINFLRHLSLLILNLDLLRILVLRPLPYWLHISDRAKFGRLVILNILTVVILFNNEQSHMFITGYNWFTLWLLLCLILSIEFSLLLLILTDIYLT
jgi:hypothetical protein